MRQGAVDEADHQTVRHAPSCPQLKRDPLGSMARLDRFSGLEFDWFAVDSGGEVALFATAGAGFIPASVLANGERHQDLSDGVENPAVGTPEVWDAYANRGLYVFDWDMNTGPYRRVRFPIGPIPAEFRNRIMQLSGMPRYPGLFREDREIASEWHAA